MKGVTSIKSASNNIYDIALQTNRNNSIPNLDWR